MRISLIFSGMDVFLEKYVFFKKSKKGKRTCSIRSSFFKKSFINVLSFLRKWINSSRFTVLKSISSDPPRIFLVEKIVQSTSS